MSALIQESYAALKKKVTDMQREATPVPVEMLAELDSLRGLLNERPTVPVKQPPSERSVPRHEQVEAPCKVDEEAPIFRAHDHKEAAPKYETGVLNEREKTYGDPAVNLGCAANLMGAYLAGKTTQGNPTFTDVDVCIFMQFMKIARMATGVAHADNYEDNMGYAELAKKLFDG